MRLAVILSLVFVAVIALTPEEEACAAPLMKKLANEKDVEVKKFVMKCFKLMNAGKKDEVLKLVKKFDQDKFKAFLDEYMTAECEVFRAEFEREM